jgi:hypothetical protein
VPWWLHDNAELLAPTAVLPTLSRTYRKSTLRAQRWSSLASRRRRNGRHVNLCCFACLISTTVVVALHRAGCTIAVWANVLAFICALPVVATAQNPGHATGSHCVPEGGHLRLATGGVILIGAERRRYAPCVRQPQQLEPGGAAGAECLAWCTSPRAAPLRL